MTQLVKCKLLSPFLAAFIRLPPGNGTPTRPEFLKHHAPDLGKTNFKTSHIFPYWVFVSVRLSICNSDKLINSITVENFRICIPACGFLFAARNERAGRTAMHRPDTNVSFELVLSLPVPRNELCFAHRHNGVKCGFCSWRETPSFITLCVCNEREWKIWQLAFAVCKFTSNDICTDRKFWIPPTDSDLHTCFVPLCSHRSNRSTCQGGSLLLRQFIFGTPGGMQKEFSFHLACVSSASRLRK